jgi:hypothetical protein
LIWNLATGLKPVMALTIDNRNLHRMSKDQSR